MKSYLDKLGTFGALIGAIAAAPACCLPLLASVGATLGFGALARYNAFITYLLQFSAALAVFGAFMGFRRHRNGMPMAIAAASAASIFYAYNVELTQGLVFLGLSGLAVAALWNTLVGRQCVSCSPKPVILQSTLTCPFCGHQQTESMPTDFCLYFYECPHCKTMLKPNAGDCCVFCSFGTVKCPPVQNGSCHC